MHRLTVLVFLAFMAVMAAACSVGPGSSPAPSVDGKTFVSTEIEGAALVPGSRIQLTFNSEGVNAHGGCNSISGPYAIAGDRFSVTRMASTAMGCEAPLLQQDEWLVDLLEDARIALAGDTLTLDNGQIRLSLLDREVVSPDRPLVGTNWVLDSIVDGDAVSSVPAGVTASMRIANGQLELDAGCNSGGGPVAVTADTLEARRRSSKPSQRSSPARSPTQSTPTSSLSTPAARASSSERFRRSRVGPPGGAETPA